MTREERNTSLEASAMALGCLNFGTKTDKQTSFDLLDRYVEKGGIFLDTANNYAFWFDHSRGGVSEMIIGQWIAERKLRNKIILATKVGARPKAVKTGFENSEGLGQQAIIEAVDESLSRLKTDNIDILYAHIDDKSVDLLETLETFDKIIKSGKVREIGCSNYPLARIIEANQLADEHGFEKYRYVQQRHSFLKPKDQADFGLQEVATEELLSYVTQHSELKLLAYSPLLRGFYSKKMALPEKYETLENQRRLTNLIQVAQELNATLNQVVFAWLIQGSPGIIPVMAASSLVQLEENLAATTLKLTSEHLAYLA